MTTVKPWGREEVLADGSGLRMKILYVQPGKRLSLQYHRRKSEVMFVLAGEGLATLGLGEYLLCQGDSITIPPGTMHRIEAGAEGDGLAVLEVSTGGGDDDIVRVEDDYGRAR